MARRTKAPAAPTSEESFNTLSNEMQERRLAGETATPRVSAWDSALDNGELTVREGIARWSEDYYDTVLSGFYCMLDA